MSTHTDVQRLGWADRYAQDIEDPQERCHVKAMIAHWQETGDVFPVCLRFQTLPMRQVARILRGGAMYTGEIPVALTTLP